MSNQIYPKYKEAAHGGQVNLATAVVKAVLVNLSGGTAYAYSATHEFLSSIPAGARISTSAAVTGKTLTNGEFNCSDPLFASVAAGADSPYEAVVFFVDTGNEATSRLICFVDTATGLPITPDGGDLPVQVVGYVYKL